MRVSIVNGGVQLALTGSEAALFMEELSDVPGGSKLRKVKQVHDELQQALVWLAHGAGGYAHEVEDAGADVYTPPRRGRPPKKLQLVPTPVVGAPEIRDEDDPLLAFVQARLGSPPVRPEQIDCPKCKAPAGVPCFYVVDGAVHNERRSL